MADERTYHGSCHCGAVRFTATTAPIEQAISCNCSICRRRGSLLAFLPAKGFRLEAGAEALTDYQFGRKIIHHLFCRTCGIMGFGRGTALDGTETVALNVRCLDEIDPDAITVVHFDGKSL